MIRPIALYIVLILIVVLVGYYLGSGALFLLAISGLFFGPRLFRQGGSTGTVKRDADAWDLHDSGEGR